MMSITYSYLVPAGQCAVEQEIKKSRFIATVSRALNRKEAVEFINMIRDIHSNARHNCWAYVAGPPVKALDVGMSDDGEPQGTAGKPMLSILQYSGIGEIVAVVTRYSGGIKLGTGGLVRAYSGTIQLALEKIELEKYVLAKELEFVVPYNCENPIRTLFDRLNINIIDIHYNRDVSITASIPEEMSNDIILRLKNITNGKIVFT